MRRRCAPALMWALRCNGGGVRLCGGKREVGQHAYPKAVMQAASVPLHLQYPNIMLRVRRAMRVCDIVMLPSRVKFLQLYCVVRTMQGDQGHWRKDVARVMVILLDDWEKGGSRVPSGRLAAETFKLERRLARLLGFVIPAHAARPALGIVNVLQ